MEAKVSSLAPWREQHHEVPANRPRPAGGNVAQLLSRFEALDTRPLATQRPGSIAASESTSKISLSHLPSGNRIADCANESSNGEGSDRNKSSSDSSCISPGQLTLRGGPLPQLLRSKTLEATSPTTLLNPCELGARHKSVAERRRVFEVDKGVTMMSRSSITAPSPSKAAQSISLQTKRTRLSDQRQLANTTQSPPLGLYASPSQEQQTPTPQPWQAFQYQTPSPTKYLPSPRFQTPARDLALGTETIYKPHQDRSRRHPNYDSSDAASSSTNAVSIARPQDTPQGPYSTVLATRVRPMVSSSSKHHIAGEKWSSSQAARHQTWMENASKIASSLSLSASTSDRESVPQPPKCKHQEQPYLGSNSLAKPTVAEVGQTVDPMVSQSTILSLRQKFDLPKSATLSSLSFDWRKRRDTAPVKTSIQGLAPSLKKSATTAGLGTMDRLEWPSYDVEKQGNRKLRKSESNLGRWNSRDSDSPLTEKIGLFESLGRQSHDTKRLLNTPRMASKKSREIPRREHPHAVRRTFRRISASCKRSSSERSTTSSQDPFVLNYKSSDGEDSASRDTELQLLPDSVRSRSEQASFCRADSSAGKRAIPCRSLVRPVLNVDGEGELYHPLAERSPLAKIPCSSFRYRLSPSTARYMSNRGFTANNAMQPGPHSRARRIISRSSGPFVSRAYCTLEQPRPVRANELRRLASLCKDRVVRRMSSRHGEQVGGA
ncbi:hypothetical protein B0J13DRAFT_160924 [Dactylonectria estremocensis]|uniref:Uncharacterized protein n=1 Tax=Dactylonectria estremocensis TaxID=1079267 RepID=A0A9P9DN45_9HYPO|nr:hypothetical protein B0J13DRAFT_160924 [Dactylonectria estremocensis]